MSRRAPALVRPEQAAHLLAERAVWHGQRASLDVEVLLGPLLRDGKVRCIGFQFGTRAFWLPRALLARARWALRRIGPIRGWIDERGLHLRWREDAGGLNLHGLPAPPSRARVLRVVFKSPTARIPDHILDQCSAAIPLSSVSPTLHDRLRLTPRLERKDFR